MSEARPVRVLVVDDSGLYRGAVTRALEGVPGLQVVGGAADGEAALAKIQPLRVEVVTLDVEMPGLDGLATLRAIRARGLPVRVVMLSAHTSRGAAMTVEALCLGAEDFITKPAAAGGDNLAYLREQLVPRILRPLPGGAGRGARGPLPATPAGRRDVLLIGSSTGGPRVLSQLFAALPADLPATVLVVQHMPPLFTRSLAEQVSRRGGLPLREARDGETAGPGLAFLAPGGEHLEVAAGGIMRVHRGPAQNHCRPSVDVLFRSAAACYGPRCLALVLTGMGADGLQGARAVVAAGGEVLAQDEASCTVYGMPRAVLEAGLARPVPLAELASVLLLRLGAQPCP